MAKFKINSQNIPPDLEPDESITLWRYMSFSSLCEILMNDHIPLISIENFSDKSEGVILRAILSKLPNTDEKSIEHTMQMCYELTHVSSWHNANDENASMWDRYTYKGEGVAIKTNAKLLLDCIPDIETKDLIAHLPSKDTIKFPRKVIIKPVEYTNRKPLDFEMTEEQLQNGYAKLCFFYKMSDYRDEKEIRILRSASDNLYKFAQDNPLIIPNLKETLKKFFKESNITWEGNSLSPRPFLLRITSASDLIEQIVVSPYAHPQFIETVKQTIRHINFCRDSAQSSLIDPNIIIESRRKDWV